MKPNYPNQRDYSDATLRREIAAAVHPMQWEDAQPEFLEKLLDSAGGEAFNEQELARILTKAESLRAAPPQPRRRPIVWAFFAGAAAAAAAVAAWMLLFPPNAKPNEKIVPSEMVDVPTPPLPPVSAPSSPPLVVEATPAKLPPLPFLTARPRTQADAPAAAKSGDILSTGANDKRVVQLPDGTLVFLNSHTRLQVLAEREVALESGEVFLEVARKKEGRKFLVRTADGEATALGTKFSVRAQQGQRRIFVTEGTVSATGAHRHLLAGDVLTGEKIAPGLRSSVELEWTKELRAALEPPCMQPDGRGGLVFRDPNGQETSFALRRWNVDVHIEDGMARTCIDQTYFNHMSSRLEATFYFPLPPDASISRLAMYANGILMEGGMAEREHARRTFETILYQRKDPALLEWMDGSTFKMRVFPMEGREEKRIVLCYTQRLDQSYGRAWYRLPSGHNMKEIGHWSLRVRLKNGAETVWKCPSHDLKSTVEGGDLVLTASLEKAAPGADVQLEMKSPPTKIPSTITTLKKDGHRYLMLRHAPNIPREAVPAKRHWALLVETSVDRDPVVARAQIDMARSLLSHAGAEDTFSLTTANTKVTHFAKEPMPLTEENRQAALAYLDEQQLIGALDLEAALSSLKVPLEKAPADAQKVLVHLGSALPVLGNTDQAQLLGLLPAEVSYVGVAVGKRWNISFMKAAASQTGGWFMQANPDEAPGWRAFELISALDAPRLTGLTVEGMGEKSNWLTFADTLAHGQEFCAICRVAEGTILPEAVTLSGRLGSKPWRETLSVKNVPEGAGYLPRAWAKLELDRLVAAGAEANKSTIIELSKASYVMSPFTSLIVLENDAMYAQYKVDRGRKDHWAPYECPKKIDVVKESFPNLAGTPAADAAPLQHKIHSVLNSMHGWREVLGVQQVQEVFPFVKTTKLPVPRLTAPRVASGSKMERPMLVSGAAPAVMESWLEQDDATSGILPPRPAALDLSKSGMGFRDGFGPSAFAKNADLRRMNAGEMVFDRSAAKEKGVSFVSGRGGGGKNLGLENASPRPETRQIPPISTTKWSINPAFLSGLLRLTVADIWSVVEEEVGAEALGILTGKIDPAARELIDRCRALPTQSVKLDGAQWMVEGSGRFHGVSRAENGLKESVLCDGTHLHVVYEELGIGGTRTLSRHHWAEISQKFPWIIAPVDVLAQGSTISLHGPRCVQITPAKTDKTWSCQRFYFGENGGLERIVHLAMPEEKVLSTMTMEADGKVISKHGADELITEINFQRTSAAAVALPGISPDLVMLPLPVRTWYSEWKERSLLHKLAAAFGTGVAITECVAHDFFANNDHRIGLYVLALKTPQFTTTAMKPGKPNQFDPITKHPNTSLAKYIHALLAQSTSLEFSDLELDDSNLFIRDLAVKALLMSYFGATFPQLPQLSIAGETRETMLIRLHRFTRECSAPDLVDPLLQAAHAKLGNQGYPDLLKAYQELHRRFPRDAFAFSIARYTGMLGDWNAAAAQFEKLMNEASLNGSWIFHDVNLHRAFKESNRLDVWKTKLRKYAQHSVDRQSPKTALALGLAEHARACGEPEFAGELLQMVFQKLPADADPALFRQAASVAASNGKHKVAADFFEKAIQRAVETEEVDPNSVQHDASQLIHHLTSFRRALLALDQPVPADLLDRCLRAADFWRTNSADPTAACQTAAATCAEWGGEKDRAWAYQTSPVGLRPNESAPWLALARHLLGTSDIPAASQAYAAAFRAEGTNGQILWDHAIMLLNWNLPAEARPLLQKLADGEWGRNFQHLKRSAQHQLQSLPPVPQTTKAPPKTPASP